MDILALLVSIYGSTDLFVRCVLVCMGEPRRRCEVGTCVYG